MLGSESCSTLSECGVNVLWAVTSNETRGKYMLNHSWPCKPFALLISLWLQGRGYGSLSIAEEGQ